MLITIDSSNAKDLELLEALSGVLSGGTPAKAVKTTPAKAAVAPAPEPDEPAASGDTMEDAVKLATDLVADGKAKHVKAALKKFGAERVSKLDASDIGAFMAQAQANADDPDFGNDDVV